MVLLLLLRGAAPLSSQRFVSTPVHRQRRWCGARLPGFWLLSAGVRWNTGLLHSGLLLADVSTSRQMASAGSDLQTLINRGSLDA
jgi:hypothetical protein